MSKKKEEKNEVEVKENLPAQEPETLPVVAESDSRQANIIRAGRPTSVCRCGEPLVRPSTPANSTWRCLRVWNANPTEDCQRGIPTEEVLDGVQVAEKLAKRKDRYADAKDVG